MEIPKPYEWTFKNQGIAEEFDSHVREQLPWYDLATEVAAHIARHYIPPGGRVYDIGASTGNIGRALAPVLSARSVEFIPVEESDQMSELYAGPGTLLRQDAMTVDYEPFDCAILFLVLMFMPPNRRLNWLRLLMERLRPGGCLIVFDKFHCEGPSYVATMLRRLTLAGKVLSKVPPEEIISKELSLGGVQRPMSTSDILAIEGSLEVFRFGEFAGFVIEKDESCPRTELLPQVTVSK